MPAAIYVRMSKDRTGEEAGVKRQLDECRAKADAEGLHVVEVLQDNDISATTGKTRPAFERLLALVAEGSVDTVVSWHPDRLYRRLKDLVRITEAAERHGLRIITVRAGELDLGTATGRLVAGLVGSVASYEGEQKADRQKAAFKAAAGAGTWHFSHRPYGYERVDGRVAVVPDEAEVVREAFTRYSAGESHHAIVTDLNRRGIATATGKPWSITALRTVLGNERYTGRNFYRGKPTGTGDWEPIITDGDWEAYQRARTARRVEKSTFTREGASLLSGLMRCGVCSAKVYRWQRSNGRYEYRCSNGSHTSISERRANALVTARLMDSVIGASLDGAGGGTLELENEIRALQQRADDAVALVALGHSTMAAQKANLDAIAAEKKALEGRRDALLAADARAALLAGLYDDLGALTAEDAIEKAAVVWDRFEAMALKKQRDLVRLTFPDLVLNKADAPERIEVLRPH